MSKYRLTFAKEPTNLGLRWKSTIYILFDIMKFDYLEMYKGESITNLRLFPYRGQWLWLEFHHWIRRNHLGGYSVPIRQFNFDEMFFRLLR